MEARNRPLDQWFNRVRTGQIRLPRFQRFEAWSHNEVTGLLETVLEGLPAGATLILELGSDEPFKSRCVVGAPAPTERPTEYLLDGQQRLTALWRSLNADYGDRTYLIFRENDEEGRSHWRVHGQARWSRNGARYPLWADSPTEVWRRGYIPVHLLRPGDLGREVGDWCREAVGEDTTASSRLELDIEKLRLRVASYNIPFLSLPSSTAPHVALDVFIKMNTSSVRLTAFDIMVAQVEEHAGESLHELVSTLVHRVPAVSSYTNAQDLVLSVAALRENRAPTQASYQKLQPKRLVEEWDALVEGIKWAVSVLEEERVFDGQRLPSVAPLLVLSALHESVPRALDDLGNAKTLVRKYLWRSFLTRRYENSAATRALQDYRGLRGVLTEAKPHSEVPIFDTEQFPLPTRDEIKRSGWPKGKDILGRGVLAISLKAGGLDLADGQTATRDRLRDAQREYHHLFPDSLLTGEDKGQLDGSDSYRALNCALVTWNTNRNISAKDPVKYLQERTARSVLGEDEIRARLASHLVPYAELAVGGYEEEPEPEARAARIQADYDAFLDARAGLFDEPIRLLCDGVNWPAVRSR